MPNTADFSDGRRLRNTSKSFDIYELVNGNQGTLSNTASVTATTSDPVTGNNTSTRLVTVGK